jgi:ABC-type nitrate/sulfonate/bicarbonate transport system substrate-binding protein
MSGLDQPLLITTTGFHVGHQRSIRAAEEQGYFREEGLADYVYDYRGLLPDNVEREGLAEAMEEHGIDIAAGPTIRSVVYHRSKGADMYIIGGWRASLGTKLIGAKGITSIEQLRGKRIAHEGGPLGERLTGSSVGMSLLKAGIDPETEVEWVEMDRAAFAYNDNPARADLLRSGKVDAIRSARTEAQTLIREGYPVLIDEETRERRRRPWKVIVATAQVIEKRPKEVSAFLRANLRGFWFCNDSDSFQQAYEMETRIRQRFTHNEVERNLRIAGKPRKFEQAVMPIDGGVSREGVASIIDDMVLAGEIQAPIKLDDVMRDHLSKQAFEELGQRPSLQPIVQKVQSALDALSK